MKDLPSITLASKTDTYNFRVGDPIALDNNFRPLTKWQRRWQRVKNFVLRPFRVKLVVTSIDRDAGVITVGEKPAPWRFL
jgi:hypothetical protein